MNSAINTWIWIMDKGLETSPCLSCCIIVLFNIVSCRVLDQHKLSREQWEERIQVWHEEHRGMLRLVDILSKAINGPFIMTSSSYLTIAHAVLCVIVCFLSRCLEKNIIQGVSTHGLFSA